MVQRHTLARIDAAQILLPALAKPSSPLTAAFDPLSLDQLNAKADMLKRLDNKYVVARDRFEAALPELARHFDVLDIDGTRDFEYETCYFDDAERSSYFDHHQKRRKRCKVRTRLYVDSGLCFVEIKLKDKRGITVKKRMRYAADKHGTLDEEAMQHVRSSYAALYDQDFVAELAPSLRVRYHRMTLVAKQGGERMTIDHRLLFSGPSASRAIDTGLLILETKSINANGIADKILRGLHQHPTKRCSKYCVGLASVHEVDKYNRFLPALRKLGAMPAASRVN